ncbi:hypothetical protein GUJ93_ZPchr0010g9392 [Zizania palustris]|uniref:PLAT domain-containing protein n=1 Tax=Zizania palustris TaxID=103762 RepID=A0A8J6BP51_ZIZPA|nr:hypothetical protein GUJ93_ZPchr0010g7701 [Zizania palustris]KAG8088602.1 hypothetical protein GUJ93_ZPchr0010g11054 [Zizania palustris]KAG8088603.1 hypothetical protein GUJ93_ZPchr0010g9392 [Zizania palustris]
MKLFIFLACVLVLAASTASAQCTFEITVKTGDRKDAGTDARVSLKVSSSRGQTLQINNLESWGQMSAGHDYFEKGNLDRFRGSGPCMSSEPCKMTISSDNSGNKPGWYLSFVTVAQLGLASHRWNVEQWLAIDEAPHQLFADRNGCGFAAAAP